MVTATVYMYLFLNRSYYPRARPVTSNEELEAINETYLEEVFSASHNDHVKAVVPIPTVCRNIKLQLEGAIKAVRSCDLDREEWQEVMVRDAKKIKNLFQETAENVSDFLIQGRRMMKHMKDFGLSRIDKAFRDGEYDTVYMLQELENVKHHLKDADATLTTARGNITDCIERVENIRDSMQKKITALLKDVEKADKGWSTETITAVYGSIAILMVVTGAEGWPAIGVNAGLTATGRNAIIIGGAVVMKQLIDIANGKELKRYLQSNARNLKGAYNDMSIVLDNLEQVSRDIRKLRIAVDDAGRSVSGLSGQLQLNPKKSNHFHSRLDELAHRCSELHTLYGMHI